MISKEWILIDVDRDVAAELADECEIPKPIANVLVGRGFDDKEKATVFMEKPPKLIRSPSKLPDCDKAVARLKQAIENKEKIFRFLVSKKFLFLLQLFHTFPYLNVYLE